MPREKRKTRKPSKYIEEDSSDDEVPAVKRARKGNSSVTRDAKSEQKEEPTASFVGDDTDDEFGEDEMGAADVVEVKPYTLLSKPWTMNEFRKDSWEYTDDRQSSDNKFHMTEKASGPGIRGLHVPSLHPQWPKFKPKISLVDWMKTLVKEKPICLDILRNEINIENGMIESKIPNFNFQPKNMQWNGWSGMLQLELSFPSIMEKCRGFLQCLFGTWEHELNNKKTTWDGTVIPILGYMNTMIELIFADIGSVRVSAPTNFIGNVVRALKVSAVFKRKFGSSGKGKAEDEIGKFGPLRVPEYVRTAKRSRGNKVTTAHLKQPKTIHEHDIVVGVQKLVREIWGKSMDTTQTVVFEDKGGSGISDKVKAAACLLELCCGSRLVGVMLVNWFQEFNMKTMHEWLQDRRDITKNDIYDPYGGWQRCIVVTRLSKEGSKAVRAFKESTDINTKDEGDIGDTMIVKPLNGMFLDRGFLDNKQFPSQLPSKTQTQIFLGLVKSVRSYMFKKHRAISKGLTSMKKHDMIGL